LITQNLCRRLSDWQSMTETQPQDSMDEHSKNTAYAPSCSSSASLSSSCPSSTSSSNVSMMQEHQIAGVLALSELTGAWINNWTTFFLMNDVDKYHIRHTRESLLLIQKGNSQCMLTWLSIDCTLTSDCKRLAVFMPELMENEWLVTSKNLPHSYSEITWYSFHIICIKF
jgi:hypothetical protein